MLALQHPDSLCASVSPSVKGRRMQSSDRLRNFFSLGFAHLVLSLDRHHKNPIRDTISLILLMEKLRHMWAIPCLESSRMR